MQQAIVGNPISSEELLTDLLVPEGVREGTDYQVFTVVKTDQPGMNFSHNWDSLGLTESVSVTIQNTRVPWSHALGWDPCTKQPVADILKIPFATMLLPTIQLVFNNFYLGMSKGALDAATNYTVQHTRAYFFERYGGLKAHVLATEVLYNCAGTAITGVYADAAPHSSTLLSASPATNGICLAV